MKPIRVLIIGPSLQDQGGVANYYNAVYPRLPSPDLDVEYLQIGSTHGRQSKLYVFSDQIRFWRKLGKFQPDVVHLNPSLDLKSFLRDGMFIFLAKLRRKPVLVFFRGWQQSFEERVEKQLMGFFRATYLRADRFIVLASSFSSKLCEWGVTVPIVRSTTAVADNLLEGLSIQSKARQFSSNGPVRLLYLARLEQGKGVLELIDAVVSLLEKGMPVSLTIAGDGNAMELVSQRVAVHEQYRGRITVTGYVRGEKKKQVLMTHHIYCFPTQYGEGMPNSVLEAMAFGMPILTCPVGGIGDFFEDGKMGVLLNDNRPEQIANAIELLISNKQRLAEISRYNNAYARKNFLASAAAEMLQKQYRDMTGKTT